MSQFEPGVEIQGAVRLSYSQVVFSAHEAAPQIARLYEDRKRIVLFSEQPGLRNELNIFTFGLTGLSKHL